MKSRSSILFAIAALIGLLSSMETAAARADVKVEFDKSFDFKKVKTWAWHPKGPGDVKMARTQDDDPDAMRKRAEPVIVVAVTAEMGRRGLTAAASAPDITVMYYLLLTTTMSTQTIGQFVPATGEWGLPPIPRATQSIKMMNRGSLVLDLSAGEQVVWRGLAQANIKFDVDEKKRDTLIHEAVRDLLRRFPPG
jgi:hypothetical protein